MDILKITTDSYENRVCSEHFEPSAIFLNFDKIRLLGTALPKPFIKSNLSMNIPLSEMRLPPGLIIKQVLQPTPSAQPILPKIDVPSLYIKPEPLDPLDITDSEFNGLPNIFIKPEPLPLSILPDVDVVQVTDNGYTTVMVCKQEPSQSQTSSFVNQLYIQPPKKVIGTNKLLSRNRC